MVLKGLFTYLLSPPDPPSKAFKGFGILLGLEWFTGSRGLKDLRHTLKP